MTNENDELPPLETLDARIRQVREASEITSPKPTQASDGKSLALKSGTEMMAGVGVGAFVGFYLDDFFGTRPWLMIVFILLGFAGGVVNLYRAVMKVPPLRDELEKLAGDTSDSPRRNDERAGE